MLKPPTRYHGEKNMEFPSRQKWWYLQKWWYSALCRLIPVSGKCVRGDNQTIVFMGVDWIYWGFITTKNDGIFGRWEFQRILFGFFLEFHHQKWKNMVYNVALATTLVINRWSKCFEDRPSRWLSYWGYPVINEITLW